MRCVSPKLIWPHRSIDWQDRNDEYGVSVPCGKCLACLMNKRQDWCFRLEQEYRYSDSSLFVTLTYDEKHYPGELRKRDLQLYVKRLRKREGENGNSRSIRYFGVGEYGSKSGRAHYHMLLFNSSGEGFVRAAWRDSKEQPIGIVHVGEVNEASIAYCTKYIVQPELSGDGATRCESRERPFAVMSRGYGIGGRYLTDEMVEWHRQGDYNFAMRYDQKVRLPRFYKTKIWYDEKMRERISRASMVLSIEQSEKERRYFAIKYGDRGEAVRTEFRDAVLARVKKKVAFTQTF